MGFESVVWPWPARDPLDTIDLDAFGRAYVSNAPQGAS